ncbi:MAG: AMP-binding protein [Rhizobium sp.]|nr:AMP-binding protein [Rhizobium sp.]
MERIWLKSYPPGIPAEIDADAYTSVVDLFEQSVARFAARPAYVCMGEAISYAELDRWSRELAAYFRNVLGLPPGARVALMLPNVLQYPVALFAILRAGCTVVNCNPLYTVRELEYQLADSGASAIVVLENFASAVEHALPGTRVRHVVVTGLGDMLGLFRGALVNAAVRHVKRLVPPWRIKGATSWSLARAQGRRAGFVPVAVAPDDIAFLQYTGGTTGVAKGAMLTHRNIVANLQQAHAWIASKVEAGTETIVTALPLYHIFSLTANCLTFLKLGATNVLIVNPRDIRGFVKELGKHRFTAITGVNTLFAALLRHPAFARIDFSALKISLGGGMAVQQKVAERWQAVTGATLIEAYGLTETSPAVTINPVDLPAFNGSIGLPLPSTEVAIRDEAGSDLPLGQTGELCVRGPQVMAGYWNRPEETALVMMADGFMRTGDIAAMDEAGFVRLIDRKKDMILVSGFNVYPNEVEAVAAMHPGVQEVAAVGVPHEKSGETVKVFVVRRDAALTADELIAHCRQGLSAYKVPHQVEFRDELPKTNVGKILRRALR